MLKTNQPEEVAYQVRYNKKSARKALQITAKEVKKNVDQLFKKAQKQFPDEGLLHVVWRNIQEEFLKKWNRFEKVSQMVYSEAFLFPSQELIQMFAEISKYRIK